MKLMITEKDVSQTEISIICRDQSEQNIQDLINYIEDIDKKIISVQKNELNIIEPSKVLYAEFINRSVFVYTMQNVYPTSISLSEFEKEFAFFRCSKSMVVNLHKITKLKSEINGRIIATLTNDEQILISRFYASSLRKTLNNK